MPSGADVVLAAAERADGANAFDRGACTEHHRVPDTLAACVLVVVGFGHALGSVACKKAGSAENAGCTFRASGRAAGYTLLRIRILLPSPQKEGSDQ